MNLEEIKGRPIASGYHNKEERDWLIAEVERLRKRLPGNDAPWTLKELDDAKARAEKAEAEREKLIRALEEANAILFSAAKLSQGPSYELQDTIMSGIVITRNRIAAVLAEVRGQECICVNEATSKNCPIHGKEQGGKS